MHCVHATDGVLLHDEVAEAVFSNVYPLFQTAILLLSIFFFSPTINKKITGVAIDNGATIRPKRSELTRKAERKKYCV